MMLRHLPLLLIAVACDRSGSPEYLAAAPDSSAGPVIIFDLDARPLPEIPFPTDLATRLDPASPTGRYLNISEEGATRMEVELRQRANTLDGFGTYSPITVAFDAPVDLCSIANTHHGEDDFGNDAILLIDLNNGEAVNLDLNRGFFPYLLPGSGNSDAPHLPRPRYYADDQRASSSTLIFDDHPEDANGNGQLDPGEDSDQDGKLDGPAHQALPNCEKPWRYVENTIWETETNTLQIRPIRPLQPGHTYAMVLTNRLKDSQGAAVRSPFPGINHPRQTGALSALPSHLSALGLSVGDIAFTWTFTTSTASEDLFAIREGMYGSGQFAWLDEKFPADWQSLHRMLDEDDPSLTPGGSVHMMRGERLASMLAQIGPETGLIEDSAAGRNLLSSMKNIDYLISGSFISPNFMVDRDGFAGDGCPDHLGAKATVDCKTPDNDDEIFEINRLTGEAVVGEGRVPFWCAIPKDEFRITPGRPFPVSIYGHGYTSTRFEMVGFAGFHARMGIATCSLEAFGHGLAVPVELNGVIASISERYHGKGLVAAVMDGQARDLDNNGTVNSGGDFWTADTFHTRDAVRQTAVDWIAFYRSLRSFDGQKRWNLGVLGTDGAELSGVAGDFDGDGQVDIGGRNNMYFAWGQSLGGIVSGVVAGVEASLTAAAPTAGAAGLLDVGVRSVQGGVKEAIHLRFMGLVVHAAPHGPGGAKTRINFIASSTNNDITVPVTEIDALAVGETMRVRNLRNGEVREMVARPIGNGAVVRVHIPSNALTGTEKARLAGLEPDRNGLVTALPVDPKWLDDDLLGDRLIIEIDRADGSTETINAFGGLTNQDGTGSRNVPLFQGLYLVEGTPLHAVAGGLGKYRSTPDYRRFVAIAATVLEAGDPVSFARYYAKEPKDVSAYDPDASPGTATMVIPTVADMNVPVNTGIAMATAAGIVTLNRSENPQVYDHYGRSQGQALADSFSLEAVVRKRRWTVGDTGDRPLWNAESNPAGIVFDADDLDQGQDAWNEPGFSELGELCAGGSEHLSCRYPWACGGDNAPCAPLKATFEMSDGRKSALRMPVVSPTGDHGFLFPQPEARLTGGYDIAGHMVNLVGWFFRSGGRELPEELCMGVHPSSIMSACVESLCVPGVPDEDALACEADSDCVEAYPLGVPNPEDPAYAARDDNNADSHLCSWIEEL
jgi:hypothetical protein